MPKIECIGCNSSCNNTIVFVSCDGWRSNDRSTTDAIGSDGVSHLFSKRGWLGGKREKRETDSQLVPITIRLKLDRLTTDLRFLIMTFLPLDDLVSIRRTCKTMILGQ